MNKSKMPSHHEISNMLEREPLKAIQLAKTLSEYVNNVKYEIAGIAFGYAEILRRYPEDRDEFYAEKFWVGRQRAFQPAKLLLHVFMYVYNGHKGPPASRASEHSCALQSIFDESKMKWTDVAQHLASNGGFDGLLEAEQDGSDTDVEELEDDPLEKVPDDEEPDDEEMEEVKNDKLLTRYLNGNSGGQVAPVPAKPAAQAAQFGAGAASRSNDDDEPNLPGPKLPPLASRHPPLKLLPRSFIEGCVLARPRSGEKLRELVAAITAQKKVSANLIIDLKISQTHELYKGGGPFVGILIDDFTVE